MEPDNSSLAPPSGPASGASTPNPRFTTQASTAEDLLKSQTVGLVHLSDFRKRRAEAVDLKEREAQSSGTSTPTNGDSPVPTTFKKKRKAVKKGVLSFGDDDEDGHSIAASSKLVSRARTPNERTPRDTSAAAGEELKEETTPVIKRLGANVGAGFVPKSMTKSALLQETQVKEQLRKEFLVMQEVVKATEFMLPFVFYDGTNIPGGVCRIKKGDFVWLFLDRARKLGAELGIGGGNKARQNWARVGVDDLMLVRGDLILPHHYDFYYFLVNKTVGYNGVLFSHSAAPTSATPLTSSTPTTPGGLSVPAPDQQTKRDRSRAQTPLTPDSELEGYDDDPTVTKVVDRRWYEKNKHIYPASTWEDFDPNKAYTKGSRRDGEGNAFFFST